MLKKSNLIAYFRCQCCSSQTVGTSICDAAARIAARTATQLEVQPSIHIFQTHETSVLAPREGCDNEWPTDAMRRLYYACDPQ